MDHGLTQYEARERLLWFLFLLVCLLMALPAVWIHLAGVPRTPVIATTLRGPQILRLLVTTALDACRPPWEGAGLLGMGCDFIHPGPFLVAHRTVYREELSRPNLARSGIKLEEPSSRQTLGFLNRCAEETFAGFALTGRRSESPPAFCASCLSTSAIHLSRCTRNALHRWLARAPAAPLRY